MFYSNTYIDDWSILRYLNVEFTRVQLGERKTEKVVLKSYRFDNAKAVGQTLEEMCFYIITKGKIVYLCFLGEGRLIVKVKCLSVWLWRNPHVTPCLGRDEAALNCRAPFPFGTTGVPPETRAVSVYGRQHFWNLLILFCHCNFSKYAFTSITAIAWFKNVSWKV